MRLTLSFLFVIALPLMAFSAFTLDSRRTKSWAGKEVVVLFLDGTLEQKNLTRRYASLWTQWANFGFKFVDYTNGDKTPESNIRISFKNGRVENSGGDSDTFIGKTTKSKIATMYLPHLSSSNPQVIVHEFGHALGLEHEHQHPDFPMEKYRNDIHCSGFSESVCEASIRKTYKRTKYFLGTSLDYASVMMYAGPWKNNTILQNQNMSFSPLADFMPQADEFGFTLDFLSLADKKTMVLLYPGKKVQLPSGTVITLDQNNLEIVDELHLDIFKSTESMNYYRLVTEKYYTSMFESFEQECASLKERGKIANENFCGLRFEGCLAGNLFYSDGQLQNRCVSINELNKIGGIESLSANESALLEEAFRKHFRLNGIQGNIHLEGFRNKWQLTYFGDDLKFKNRSTLTLSIKPYRLLDLLKRLDSGEAIDQVFQVF